MCHSPGTNSNGQFGMTSEIVRNLAYFDEDSPGLIVVGVGYPVGQFYNALGPRSLDLTPNRADSGMLFFKRNQ